jgi:branched-chain amino acid transport system permease protein
MPVLQSLLQQLVNGLSMGSVYALFALGYTLVFSILGVINFAHGAVFAFGAYCCYLAMGGAISANGLLSNFVSPSAGLPFFLALLVGAVGAGILNLALEYLIMRPLRRKNADPIVTLVATLGMTFLLVNILQLLFGAEMYAMPSRVLGDMPAALNFGTDDAPILVRTVNVLMFLVSVFLLVGLHLLIHRTRFGKGMMAVAEDWSTASLMGIPVDFVVAATFFLSVFLGGVAGTLVGLSVSIAGPYFGIMFGLKGLAVIVLGGIGNLGGTVLAGWILGLIEAAVPPQFSAFRDAIAFGILFVTLVLRPHGLLGSKPIVKV